MTEWVSLANGMIWPLLVAVLLVLGRKQVKTVFLSISKRIEGGDSFQIGPSGLSLGKAEPKMTQLNNTDESGANPSEPAPPQSAESESGAGNLSPSHRYQDTIYLRHKVSSARMDSDGVERRGISIVLDADSEGILDDVDYVVYHLHPTFANPSRRIEDRVSQFQLRTRAWGEFNLSAEVNFKKNIKPLTLYRYLNFS